MVSSSHFNGYAHGVLFVFILRRGFFVLLYQELLATCEYRPVWLELRPDLKDASALDVAERGVELQVGLKALGVEQLDLHGLGGAVEEDDLLAVELLVDEDVQVVLGLVHVNGDVDALALDYDGDGLAVVLVLEEDGELLEDRAELEGHEGEGDLGGGVAFDLCCSLKLHLRQELLIRISLQLFAHLFLGFSLCYVLLFKGHVVLGGYLLPFLLLLLIHFLLVLLFLLRLQELLFQLAVELVLVEEGDVLAVPGLHVYLGGERSVVLELKHSSGLLPVDDRAEVDEGVVSGDQGFLAGALEGDEDLASLCKDRENAEDVLVQLWGEGDSDGRRKTS